MASYRRAAQSLAVAAMVASLATTWKAGCDSKKRATGSTRNEYVDPPYGPEDQVREDEPTCGREEGSEGEPTSEQKIAMAETPRGRG